MIYTEEQTRLFHSITMGEKWVHDPSEPGEPVAQAMLDMFGYDARNNIIGGTVVYKRDLDCGRIIRTGEYYEFIDYGSELWDKAEPAYIIGVDCFNGHHADIELTDFLKHWHHDENIAKVPVDREKVLKPIARIFYILMMCLYWPIAGPLWVLSMILIAPLIGLFTYIFTGRIDMNDIGGTIYDAFTWFPHRINPDSRSIVWEENH